MASLALLALAGCVDAHDQAVAAAGIDLQTRKAACDARYPEQRGHYLPHAVCVDGAVQAYNDQANDGNDGDLLAVEASTREALARKVDLGQITKEDANAQLVQVHVSNVSEAGRRQAERRASMLPYLQLQQQQAQFQQQQEANDPFKAYLSQRPINCNSSVAGSSIQTTCN